MDNKKIVYTTTQEHLAIIVKGALEKEGIRVLSLNQKDSAYTVFGSVELYVEPEDEARAKEIIAKNNE